MQKEGPIDSVARMVRSFRSNNADGKKEREYLEILADTIGHLHERVGPTRSMRVLDVLQSESENACRVEQIILPTFKGKLKSLSLALNSPDWQDDAMTLFDPILNKLIEIDNLLEQLEGSIGSTRRDTMLEEEIFPFRVGVISRQFVDLYSRGLCPLFAAYQAFFGWFDYSNLHFIRTDNGRHVDRLTTASVEKIDDLIPTLRKPLLCVAKKEWKAFVEGIDFQFKEPVKRRILNSPHGHSDDWFSDSGKAERDKSFKAVTLVSKLCRIYFHQLSRSTANPPLIFASPSMEMKEDRLNHFFHFTQTTTYSIKEFLEMSITRSTDRQSLQEATYNLEDSVAELSQILEKYWDTLLLKEDPPVNQEAIAEARRWLKSWRCMFLIATEKFMRVTGCRELHW
ncbi:hypothetical protein PGT21_020533 [Puccinia graminis f. sp. tritici]|uniref:Uncharacterized protein n=2 Tax=Puccinia graminis f. sp. tritici TaxID=56615 RepID=E3K4S7_PUCGT|nr:uncharacterized protein PGTG_05563 [Puccinia graminis f. sp. tritici CRL 75-36-700-3]EFP79242.2 hypothetical protein PGTG_05563 [Puccinia graminis f. sp. tritici CRL 75-36-700-3]KAA1087047.1 hypothetical protein PGT21_020533 [Puccinia graminis f. sp. tritici]